MDLKWIALLVVLALVAVFAMRGGANRVSGPEAVRLVKAGARLVDVRTRGEFAGGHLDGAVNVPLQELGARLSELHPGDKPLVVYCRSGARSAQAASLLRGAGFTQVHDLGSIGRWPSAQ
jgi:phage shock protein E